MSPEDTSLSGDNHTQLVAHNSQPVRYGNPPTTTPTVPIVTAVAVEKAAEPAPYTPSLVLPPAVRLATDIAYTAISVVILGVVIVALIVTVAWFGFDLTHIDTRNIPAGISSSQHVRDQVITATANFLANMALVLVLIEVLTSVVMFIRTRRASIRPILLIPLFLVMRGVIIIANQLIVNPPGANTELFFKQLAQMGALGLVGVFISLALALSRDPSPRRRQQAAATNVSEGEQG